MGTHLGSEGSVDIGTDLVGQLLSFRLEEEVEIIETTELSDTDKTYATGQKSWSGEIVAMFDETDTAQDALTNAASVTIHFFPEGQTSGDEDYTGTALVQGITLDVSGPNDTIKAAFRLQGTGSLTKGTVA